MGIWWMFFWKMCNCLLSFCYKKRYCYISTSKWCNNNQPQLLHLMKVYIFLSTNGYIHLTVNHSTNFVDPITSAHTQRIEYMWATAKLWRRTHGYISKDVLQEYLYEFFYRYNHGKSFDYIWKNLYKLLLKSIKVLF